MQKYVNVTESNLNFAGCGAMSSSDAVAVRLTFKT